MSVEKRQTTRGLRYDVRLRDPNGKPYTRTFGTRKEAERFERSELTARDRGDWTDSRMGARTFADVAAEWLASNPSKRPTTLAHDRSAIDVHLVPALGAKTMRSLTPRDVQALVNDLSPKMAPRSVRRVHSTLRAICNYAVASDIVARSPLRGIKLPAPAPTSVHVFSPAELVTVADALPAEHRPMVWLGAVLGLRWGEVAGLRVGAVNVLARTLVVDQAVTKDETGRPYLGEPKSTAGRRTLSMPGPLADVLAAHTAALGLTAADPDALLFPAPDGGLLRYSNWLRRSWWPAMVKAGLGTLERDGAGRWQYDGPGFHDLRRTSATALVVDGVDVKTAQYRLGHSSPVLTLSLYAQAVTAAEVDAANRVGARLMGAPRNAPRDGRAMESESDAQAQRRQGA